MPTSSHGLTRRTAPVKLSRIIKNGNVIHGVSGGGTSISLDFLDESGDYRNKFYYVDLVQVGGKKAISSPVWTN